MIFGEFLGRMSKMRNQPMEIENPLPGIFSILEPSPMNFERLIVECRKNARRFSGRWNVEILISGGMVPGTSSSADWIEISR